MTKQEQQTLALALEEINKQIIEIKNVQKQIQKNIEIKNKVLMQRINKIQEHDEIEDIRAKLLEQQLNIIKCSIVQLKNKLY